MIRTSLVYAFIGLYVLLLAPPAMLWVLLTKNVRLIFTLSRFAIRASGVLAGIRVRSEGKEKILPDQTYLFLSNHQGNIDGPVLVHAIPRDWKAIIKKEMMRIPLLSLLLKQANFVPVERSNPIQARKAIDSGAALLSEGNSFVTFPEGTRSRDGRLGVFKKGAFIMAIKAQIPIVPITIVGSSEIQARGKYTMKSGMIRVVFHDPIPTAGMNLEDRHRLIDRTRQAIASALPAGS
jgi:1-acyl-sn-glycerol-3-phosphate acyltransferase